MSTYNIEDDDMRGLRFKCCECGLYSAFIESVDKRYEVYRAHGHPKVKVTFFCEHCGSPNLIEISKEDEMRLFQHVIFK